MDDPTIMDPAIAEECAHDVVECIRQFVDALRAEFPPSQAGRSTCSSLPLYTRMVERGVWEQVQRAVQKQKEWENKTNSSDSSSPCHGDQRILLLRQIILPSLDSLTACYRVLDDIPQPSPPQSAPANNKNKKKPAPPRGMLSIQQYTDIACFLEFLVCIGILPLLDPFVLTPLDDRIRHGLPKSLAGRMPKASLSWGITSQAEPPESDDNLLLDMSRTMLELVLLDRFRPMLLPRHVADIYAAFLQYEHNANHGGMRTATTDLEQKRASLCRLLGLSKTTTSALPCDDGGPTLQDDATLQAKAYQTLLLQGTKTPSWLRQRVAPLLTKLACTNLASIVQVFVPLQQQLGEVSSMASQRLGRTLATSSCNTKHYVQGIGQQIRLLLEMLYTSVSSSGGQVTIPVRPMAILQTIWAVLFHWPKELVEQELILPWQQSLLGVNNGSNNIHKTLRQMGTLCASAPPPATNPWRILHHFFFASPSSNEYCPTSIMNQLIRIASMPAVVKSTASEEARTVIHWLCQATAASSTVGETHNDLPSGPAFLASAWVHALAPSEWDIAGHFYKVMISIDEESPAADAGSATSSTSPNTLDVLERIEIQQASLPATLDVSTLTNDISRRAQVFFDTCHINNNDKANDSSTNSALQGVASWMFRLLLKLYLPGSSPVSLSSSSSRQQADWTLELVAICLLPALCDKCSPEILLFGSGDDAQGLLESIRLILSCVPDRWRQDGLDDKPNQTTTTSLEGPGDSSTPMVEQGEDATMFRCLELLKGSESTSRLRNVQGDFASLREDKERDETLLSIASIVLSLLIAMLELGTKLRSAKEESALQSFLPTLSVLAEFRNQTGTCSLASQVSDAGLSDMAGYAMALIASRKAQPQPEAPTLPSMSTMDKVRALIHASEEDLASTQPPIRARGMVSLGRLARGYLGIVNIKEAEPTLVVDVNENMSQESLIDFTVREVLRLSMKALSDEESYVYLAAVQTIVAIGDMRPRQVLPKLGVAIVSGKLDTGAEPLVISNEQRIKLAEALMFIIRRRAAPAEYLAPLINLMVFGSTEKIGTLTDEKPNDQDRMLFAEETDKYFLGVESTEISTLEDNKKEKWKEQDIRLKTGGPIFASEEQDLVRSIRLSTLAELASVAPPASLAPYCRLLIRLIVDVLRLDTSRTTCRAAALLAREIYGCLLREQDDLGEAVGRSESETQPLPMAVAVVSLEEEELLVTSLQNWSAGSASDDSSKLDDPATVARCQEALALREEADELLLAARLLTAQNGHDGNIPSIFTSMLRDNKPPIVEIDKARALGGNTVPNAEQFSMAR